MQLLVHLPDDLVARFRNAIPARQRSDFIRELLERSLPNNDDALYRLALEAQAYDDAHPNEFADFNNTIADGLDPNETFDLAKLDALCQK
ncbi:hypothetical protein FK216_08195 [Moraxellaceae bacterium AER2_44_116]|nr:hypothetical protein [Moraxellaceae bacterium]TQC97726.1 hypothetical protein FK216_08195 [Moraxellaceae bacterium AER2_44_116]